MADLQKLGRMSDQHAKQRDAILLKLIKALLLLWGPLNRPDDRSTVLGFAARSATLSMAASDSARRLERSFVTSVLREMGAPASNLPAPLVGSPRANADPLEVWQRPVHQWIDARRAEESLERQKQAMEQRIRDIAGVEVLYAARDENQRIYASQSRVLGFRRVIHPERSRTGTCGLCLVAASQYYRSGDLLPLHGPSCHCDTVPILKGADPGLELNRADLDEIYAAAGGTAADLLRETRVQVSEHGELGPILVRDGEHFRTPEEAGRPAYVRPTQQSVLAQARKNLTAGLAELDAATKAYDDFLAANPGAELGGAAGETDRIALFRTRKRLTEYVAAVRARVATLEAGAAKAA